MTTAVAFDVGLAALLLVIGTWTIAARQAFVAVVVFVVYGLLLALVWVRLSAVDVALTEAAIGSGVTGLLLVDAAARLRETDAEARRPGMPTRLVTALLCTLISAGLATIILFPEDVPPTLAPLAKANLAEIGLGNPVAGVLFVYRTLDTLLEKVVLLLALVGVWSLASDQAWGSVPGFRPYSPRSDVLILLAQVLPPFGIVAGIYMFWVGADHPGGAFQGGTVLAAMWLLVMMSGLRDPPPIGRMWVRALLIVGPVIFLAVGFAGSVVAGAFLAYPAGYAKPLIVLIEATVTLSIGVTLGLLAAGPPERIRQR
jgi:multisubunit Na+/H+ antiporter MnhB subunit